MFFSQTFALNLSRLVLPDVPRYRYRNRNISMQTLSLGRDLGALDKTKGQMATPGTRCSPLVIFKVRIEREREDTLYY